MLTSSNYNPDVLSCIANLSSDEVFTPPQLVNQILDLLPTELWSDKKATFLDPGCKSGVFLREIAKRLDKGLEKQIPDRQKRINHIFKNQLFGLAITELTALLSRRSVYCSKTANGKYSVCEAFDNPEGNIRFGRVEHTWENGRCVFCGASKENYERGDELETHAYRFHSHRQAGGDLQHEIRCHRRQSAVSVERWRVRRKRTSRSTTCSLSRRRSSTRGFLSMIIPSRWFAGGKGLDEFRESMLHDRSHAQVVDYPSASDGFPGVEIRGWRLLLPVGARQRRACASHDDVRTANRRRSSDRTKSGRLDVFVRRTCRLSRILTKVAYRNRWQPEPTFDELVSARKPFGLDDNFHGASDQGLKTCWSNCTGHSVLLEERRSTIEQTADSIDKWKVIDAGRAAGNRH